jgi:beta-glucosidase
MSTHDFPQGFLWGTSTAAHQVEGSNSNNEWWDWEQVPGHIKNGDNARIACDWWGGKYAEDFDRAQSLGTNAHRLSIEWSRLEPRENEWDEHASAYYRKVLTALRERGMVPFVTLLHFTQPRWFMGKGGWLSDDAPQVFARFVTRAVGCLGDLASHWITINEPNLYVILSYLWKGRPPGGGSVGQAFRVGRNLMLGHAAAYHAIHHVQPTARVSFAHAWRPTVPANPRSSLDRLCAWVSDWITNRVYVRSVTEGVFAFPLGHGEQIAEAKQALDYFGLNYYFEHPVAFDKRQPGSLFCRMMPVDCLKGTEFESWTGMGNSSSESFSRVLQNVSRFNLPIYITENGMFDAGGDLQERYLITHLDALRRAIRAGIDVRGYFWWSLIDNFEWDSGYWLRFGLYHVDFATQARTPRQIAKIYERIIRENSVHDDLLKRYGAGPKDMR